MRDVCRLPLLSADTEHSLCRRWIDHHDIAAAHQLAGSHLCLVVKIALGYRGYGLPVEELIGEGYVGLMRAVCRFDPGRGARFATYAVWWVRAAVQQYILHNWSLAKMGATTSQKKLFFNLRRIGHVRLMRAACIYDPACGARFIACATRRRMRTASRYSIVRASFCPRPDAIDAGAVSGMPPLQPCGSKQRALVRFASSSHAR